MADFERKDRQEEKKAASVESLAEMSFNPVNTGKDVEEATVPEKRGPGRPRKNPAPDAPKRPRGRPRKNPEEKVATSKEEKKASEIKQERISVEKVLVGSIDHSRVLSYKAIVFLNNGNKLNFFYIDDPEGDALYCSKRDVKCDLKFYNLVKPVEKKFSDMPEILRRDVFRRFYPNGNDDDFYRFTYGEERWLKRQEDLRWAREHPLSRHEDTTIAIRDALGGIADIKVDWEGDAKRDYCVGSKNRFFTITDLQGNLWMVRVLEDCALEPPYDRFDAQKFGDETGESAICNWKDRPSRRKRKRTR